MQEGGDEHASVRQKTLEAASLRSCGTAGRAAAATAADGAVTAAEAEKGC